MSSKALLRRLLWPLQATNLFSSFVVRGREPRDKSSASVVEARPGNVQNPLSLEGHLTMNSAPLSQLQVFLVVARLRSFSAAARELRVSTSAVSQAVRQLEEQLRVTLLVRTTRSVSLTDEGQRLVEARALGSVAGAIAGRAAGRPCASSKRCTRSVGVR